MVRFTNNVVDGEVAQTGKWRTPTRLLRVSSYFSRAFLSFSPFFLMDPAPKILEAIATYRSHEYSSIRATARAFSLPITTLRRHLTGGVLRSTSHESEQYLSPAEEKILV